MLTVWSCYDSLKPTGNDTKVLKDEDGVREEAKIERPKGDADALDSEASEEEEEADGDADEDRSVEQGKLGTVHVFHRFWDGE